MKTTLSTTLDKRALGQAVGDELIKRHGKRRFYRVQEVVDVFDVLELSLDGLQWALAAYSSPAEFAAYSASIHSAADYAEMKSAMFEAMTGSDSSSWFDLDMSWLDWPDFDFSGFFDFFDFSP
jgi:hypothetical protein